MPILEIDIVVGPLPLEEGLASNLADEAGAVLGSELGNTWVRLRELPLSHYAENGGSPSGILPVFVKVLRADPPQGPELRREMEVLAAACARACHRPLENAHIIYEASARGRVGFGGKLVE